MGFIAISESTHFGLSKTIFKIFFLSLEIVRQSMENLGLDPSVDPIRAQTLGNIF